MRVPYTLSELNNTYERLVLRAISLYESGDLTECVICIQSAAQFQYNLNYIYTDDRLERLVRMISADLYSNDTFSVNHNVVFFYDSFCLDNRGLTQHYLDALVNSKTYKIIYIVESNTLDTGRDIVSFLMKNNVEIQQLPSGPLLDRCNHLYQLIRKYRPAAALFHLTPYTVLPFIAFYPFHEIKKYQINLTDHAFWLGNKDFFNYTYEFRTYGIEVSLEKRGYDIKQLILNQYYPWQSGLSFKGFPINTDGKVVILSGGAMYKIEGDNDMYYVLVKNLLDTFPEVILLYAGSGNDSHLQKFIRENNFTDRFILLGNRSDIDAVFKNSDIYLSTYPFGGGLMSQLAAINRKPILLYKSKEIERLICTKEYRPYALPSVELFIEEAAKLIRNKVYREERGKFFSELLIGQDEFRKRFCETFMNLCYEPEIHHHEDIDYDTFTKTYVRRINNNSFGLIEKPLIRQRIISFKILFNFFLQIPRYIKCRVIG